MRRVSYIKRASRRFLEGTRCNSPAEAVEQGLRTLSLWTTTLKEEREREAAYLQERVLVRRRPGWVRNLRLVLD
jgi:hypothetical protein